MRNLDKKHVEANIIKDERTGCWVWSTYYGKIAPARVRRGPHRAVYNLYKGIWLEANILLIQECEDKRCVNPDHMEERHAQGNPGAERDCDTWNVNGDQTFKNGLKNPKTRLTPEKVQTIKALLLCGFPQTMLSEYFDTNRSTIHAIRHNKTWRHIAWPDKKRAVKIATIWCRHEKIGAELARLEALVLKKLL